MKKVMIILALLAGVCLAQRPIGRAFTRISEINGTSSATNYYGKARTTEYSDATPSTNDAVWAITRVVLDASGNAIEVKNAYGSGEGDNSLFTTAWTNRVNATYK